MNHEGCIGIWMEDGEVIIDDTDGTVEITFISNMYNDDEEDEQEEINF
jgi:hypothetical protein